VSDADRTAHLDEPGGERRPSAIGTIIGVLSGVLVFLLIVLGILLLGGDGEEPDEPDVVASPVPDDEEEPTPTPTPEPTPTPTPEPTPADREPGDADAAAFASDYQPPGARDVESVTVDVTGDGRPEVVVTSIANNTTRVDVAVWNGEAYEVAFTDQGGEADEITRFTVSDVTGDERREIITIQAFGQDGESLSIWAWDGEELARQPAEGGCWDGSHTYGVVGVDLRREEREIAATCDAAPLPTAAWPSDVYVWDGDAWTYDRTETP
jgi:hypothetical protein